MSKAFTQEDAQGAQDPLLPRRREREGKRPITAGGRERLEKELAELTAERVRLLRPENALGSELRQREVERRMRTLGEILEGSEVPDVRLAGEGQVTFGSSVTVVDEDGARTSFQLVGPDEADVKAQRLSVESPLGRALLGKSVEDWVTVDRPRGSTDYQILAVKPAGDADPEE